MISYYVDTSALVKRYVAETGSAWMHSILTASDVIVLTAQLAILEIASALNRRVREGVVTPPDYARLGGDFRDDCRDRFQIILLNNALINLAWLLLERHPLRASDVAHLAAALIVNQQLLSSGANALVFLSSDDRLLDAARAEGLQVENPNWHL